MQNSNQYTVAELIKITGSTSVLDLLDDQTLERLIATELISYSRSQQDIDAEQLASLYRVYSLRVPVSAREVFAKTLAEQIAQQGGSVELGLRPILMGESNPSISQTATMDLAYIILLQHGSATAGPKDENLNSLREFLYKPLPGQIPPLEKSTASHGIQVRETNNTSDTTEAER